MERNDQQAIETLFGKLAEVERQGMPRDPEADRYIQDMIARQPGAPYYMAQTIVMQEKALEATQARLEALERRGEPEERGGFFDGLFGGGERQTRGSAPGVNPSGARGSVPSFRRPDVPADAGRSGYGARSGGGFLAGAAQTAMGVAGGILLGNAIAGMFDGPDAAQAADATDASAETPAETQDASVDEAGAEDGDFGGGDFGDLDI